MGCSGKVKSENHPALERQAIVFTQREIRVILHASFGMEGRRAGRLIVNSPCDTSGGVDLVRMSAPSGSSLRLHLCPCASQGIGVKHHFKSCTRQAWCFVGMRLLCCRPTGSVYLYRKSVCAWTPAALTPTLVAGEGERSGLVKRQAAAKRSERRCPRPHSPRCNRHGAERKTAHRARSSARPERLPSQGECLIPLRLLPRPPHSTCVRHVIA